MAAVGISIGDSNSYVAVSKVCHPLLSCASSLLLLSAKLNQDGKSSVVANAGGDRSTPSVVAMVAKGEVVLFPLLVIL
jgi:molecular chaperone DnaK (HSP70)